MTDTPHLLYRCTSIGSDNFSEHCSQIQVPMLIISPKALVSKSQLWPLQNQVSDLKITFRLGLRSQVYRFENLEGS